MQVEDAFLVQCARSAVSRNVNPSEYFEVPENMNWSYFLDQTLAHSVAPLVYTQLKGHAAVPDFVQLALRSYSESVAGSNLLYAAELSRLMKTLKKAGIITLTYKGPTLAHLAYGSVAMRPFDDLDILVSKKDLVRGVGVLQEEGYVLNEIPQNLQSWWLSTQHDYAFTSQNKVQLIELHWDIAERFFSFHFDIESLLQRRCPSTLDANVDTLAVEDAIIVLCVHGAKHGWAFLLWICDVAAVLQRSSESDSLDWDVLVQRACEVGATRALHLGLLLVSEFLQYSSFMETAPQSLQQSMKADRMARVLCRETTACLFSLSQQERMNSLSWTYFLRLRESNRDKIEYLWRRSMIGVYKRSCLVFSHLKRDRDSALFS